jgi:hypothetical protein
VPGDAGAGPGQSDNAARAPHCLHHVSTARAHKPHSWSALTNCSIAKEVKLSRARRKTFVLAFVYLNSPLLAQ